jgi:hypothetical protein
MLVAFAALLVGASMIATQVLHRRRVHAEAGASDRPCQGEITYSIGAGAGVVVLILGALAMVYALLQPRA